MNHTLVGNCAIYGSSTKGTSVSVNKVIYSCKKIAATWILYQITTPNKYLGCWYNGLVFCRNNGWIMENMDKWLIVPKWVLVFWPKIPQLPQNYLSNLSAQAQKFRISTKKASLGVRSPCAPRQQDYKIHLIFYSTRNIYNFTFRFG